MVKQVSQPTDSNGFPLGAVAVEATANISFTGTSQEALLPGNLAEGLVYRFMCTQDCYLAFGTSPVTATTSDQLETYGGGFGKVPSGATHFAVLQVTAAGIASMSEIG